MLAAFLVKRDKEPPASSEAQARVVAISPEIENQLAQRLPGYMNPTAYFLLHELPRNSSGKLDRCRLREVGAGFTLEQLSQARETSRGEKQALKTDTERALQQIWSHVLGIDAARIGANDNFLRLGGDSIGAMQASAAARARGINTSTADILQRKTVSLLAAAAADDWSAKHRLPELDFAGVAAEKEEDCQPFELSPVQRLCLTTQPDSIFCSDQGFNLRLCEHISLERLAEALETIVMRHPMLRARFKQCGKDGWKQHIVSDSLSSFHLDQAVSTEFVGAKAVLETEMCRCRGRLNIETGPVLAAMLFESEDTHGSQNLFLAAHHLVVDAMSWRILLGELQELLRGRRLPTLSTVSFQRWCSFQAQNATDSVTSLKGARLQPPALLYWGSGALVKAQGAMVSSDFTLAEAPTAALMGSCNLAFDTLPLELMVASLVHSFSAVFRDRPPPTVFTEGHGREAWGDRVDLSHTIGLFTTVSPSSESRETAMESDLLGTICRTKDFARSMSDKKGACLFTTTTHAGEYPVEVIFNYVGPHQPMGQGNSLFDMVSSPSEDSNPIVGSQLHRLSLLSFKASLDRRSRLAVTLEYPTDIRHSEKIGTWMDEFEATLVGLGALLLERLPEWTLTDFPLAFTSYDHLREFDSTIMHRLGITNRHDIEDMYPCSGLQEGLVVAQAKSPGLYRSRFNVEITATQVENGDCIDVSRIERAWRAVVKRHSLLRAILVNGVPGSTGVMHIVLRNPAVGISIDAHAEDEDENDDGHASRYKYAKYAPQHHLSISRITNTHVRLCFEINHTIVDGHSGRLLLTDFWQAYRTGTLASSGPSYRDYIQYVQQRPRDVDREFWVKYLDGVQPCFFSSSSVSVKNLPSQDLSVAVPGLNTGAIHDFCSRWEVTSASVVQMAWALVLRCYTGSEIPCFGNLASGRDAPLDGVEDIFGPLIGMMPYCVRLGAGRSVIETVRQGQKDMIAGMPHQTYPLMEIHKVLGVGSSGLFNSIMSFQRVDDRPPTPSADGHVMRERGGSGLSEVSTVFNALTSNA